MGIWKKSGSELNKAQRPKEEKKNTAKKEDKNNKKKDENKDSTLVFSLVSTLQKKMRRWSKKISAWLGRNIVMACGFAVVIALLLVSKVLLRRRKAAHINNGSEVKTAA